MRGKSREQIEREYADTLGEGNEDLWPLVQSLDAHYSAGDPLARLPGPPDRRVSPSTPASGPMRRPIPMRILSRRPLAFGMAAAATLLLSISIVFAASGILNLGKPTNAMPTSAYFPLSGFRRDPRLLTIPKVHGKAQVLFIGTLSPHDRSSGPERWPMVKALEQFGTFTGIRTVDHVCVAIQNQPPICTIPTYDWSSAAYHSRYVDFEHKDLYSLDAQPYSSQPFQRLSKTQLALYLRLTHVRAVDRVPADPYGAGQALLYQRLPIVAIGDYAETQSQVLVDGDFQAPTSNSTVSASWLSFQQIQSALATGDDPPETALNADVNAEDNIVTALICHADGGKPRGVCGRSVVKVLMRRLH